MNRPLSIGVALSVAAAIVLGAALYAFPEQRVPTVAGVTSGLVVSLFAAYLVYLLQYPDFAARLVPSETKGRLPFAADPSKATIRWVHVLIKNTSSGFLGGGTAANVGGWVVLTKKKAGLEKMTKWEHQRNPLGEKLVVVGGNSGALYFYDETQVEQAKRMNLNPGQEEPLDIAFKPSGDRNCYLSVPENFAYTNLKNPEVALVPDDYPFEVFVEYRGKRRFVGSFIIKNAEGVEPESLTLANA